MEIKCTHKWISHHTGGSEQVPTIVCRDCGQINMEQFTPCDAMYHEQDVDQFIVNAKRNGRIEALEEVRVMVNKMMDNVVGQDPIADAYVRGLQDVLSKLEKL